MLELSLHSIRYGLMGNVLAKERVRKTHGNLLLETLIYKMRTGTAKSMSETCLGLDPAEYTRASNALPSRVKEVDELDGYGEGMVFVESLGETVAQYWLDIEWDKLEKKE